MAQKKKHNPKTRRYWNDIRAIRKATGLSFRAARANWRALAYTPDGARVARAGQVRAHRKALRERRKAEREFRAAAKKKRSGLSGSARLSALDLYDILRLFGDKGYSIEYATPATSGNVPAGAGGAAAEDAARSTRAALDPLMRLQGGDAWKYWRTMPYFRADWDDDLEALSIMWIGPDI